MGGFLLLGTGFLLCGCGSTHIAQQNKQKFSADELFMQGQRLKLQHRSEEAIAAFKGFQKMKPENATAYFEIARLYNNLRQPDSVLFYAEKAARLDSSNKWMQQFYARTLANRKHYAEAAVIFKTLSAKYPYSDDFVFQQALMLFYAKKYRQALPLFNQLEKKKGISEEIIFQKQRIYVRLDQIDSAAGEIRKLISQNPDDGRYYALLAKMYARNNEPVQAVGVYKKLLERQPGNPQAQLALGILYKQMKHTDKFKQFITTAFHNPDFGIEEKLRFIFPFLKYVEVDTSEKEDAIWLCRLLTQIHGQDARAYALFGDMFFKCKQKDSALFQYKKALYYEQTRYEIWNQIMLIYAEEGRVDSLMAYSREAVRHFPDNPKARYFKGMAYLFEGKNENALTELQQALKIGVKNTTLKGHIYEYMAGIYLQMNNRKEAARYKKMAESLQIEEKKNNSVTFKD